MAVSETTMTVAYFLTALVLTGVVGFTIYSVKKSKLFGISDNKKYYDQRKQEDFDTPSYTSHRY